MITIPTDSNFLMRVRSGAVAGASIVQKFGSNGAVGTTFVPVAVGGIYRTPQVGAATALRIKAGNANDTVAGSGARVVHLEGLDETGTEIDVTLNTAGVSASTATTETFTRLFRAHVYESGTYATSAAGSHAAAVVIENAAGTEDWATIDSSGFAHSQTEIGSYTVPLGKAAYVLALQTSTESAKSTDVLFFAREGILDTAAPYQAMRIVYEAAGTAGIQTEGSRAPHGPYSALTDIGYMAKLSTGTGAVNVDFEILLLDV